MDASAVAEYDRTRNFSAKAVRALCYAPFTALFFDATGMVRVCCFNHKHPVGNILESGLDAIWQGLKIQMLRGALANYEFGPGCWHCEFRTADGSFVNTPMRRYDQFPVDSLDPQLPVVMDFALSNACNLECVMCDGAHSSAIRARREKLPPMPRLYSDEILESFRPYLPHLKRAKFLGGEPFLIVEYFRLWEMMLEDGLHTPCHVTTNGTQYNARVERILDALPVSLAVSLDGVTKKTVESIRVNANHDEQMVNLRRFREYCRTKRTHMSLTFCLMAQNWHEFGEFCLMADEMDCDVGVNTVLRPREFSLHLLPPVDLCKVVKSMAAEAPRLESKLTRNRAVWFGEFHRLERKCQSHTTDAVG